MDYVFDDCLTYSTVVKILIRTFGMTAISEALSVKKEGKYFRIDTFAYKNEPIKTAIIVVVSDNFQDEFNLEYLETKCRELIGFMPEHRDKKCLV